MKNALVSLLVGLVALGFTGSLAAKTVYVNAATGSDANDGLTAITPLLTLQAAVDAADEDDLVLVAPGAYDQGGSADNLGGDSLTNRVWIDKRLTLRSSDGPAQTLIVGVRGSGPNGLGDDAMRGVLAEYSGTVIEGFTFTNGFTRAVEWDSGSSGGGARLGYDVVVSNCVFIGNSAMDGGGTYNGNIYACRYINNTAYKSGGGAANGQLENCVLTGNSAANGGGAAYGTLYHCTVAGNTASAMGGGVDGCSVYNSIIRFNQAPIASNYRDDWDINYSCTTPLPPGDGNVNVDPHFADINDWSDLRLTQPSLCINAASSAYTSTTLDLDGNPRISSVAPDMGAYEWQGPVLPIVSFTSASVVLAESAGGYPVALTLSEPSATNVTFELTQSGTADNGVDYVGVPATVTFAAGTTETNFFVSVINDTLPEYPETIICSLDPNPGYRMGIVSHTATILDDDGMPEIIDLLINDGADGTASRTISLSFTPLHDPTEYAVGEDSTFTNPVWTAFSGSPIASTLSAGYGHKAVWLAIRKPHGAGHLVSLPAAGLIYYGPPLDEAIDLSGETVTTGGEEGAAWFGVVDLDAQGGSLASSQVTLPPGADEINSWLETTIDLASSKILSFTYEVVGDGDLTFVFNEDYYYLDGWDPGQHFFQVEVPAGTHTLRWEAAGYTWDGNPGHALLDAVTLTTPPPYVSFETAAQTVTENVGTVPVTVLLEFPSDDPVTVVYEIGGDAVQGDDYTLNPDGFVTFAPGVTRTNFLVTVIDDTEPEHGETASFTLLDGAGYRLGAPDQHTLTILANDGLIDLLNLSLENGAPETTNTVIRVDIVASETPAEMMVSENGDFSGAGWGAYSPGNMFFTLSPSYGFKTVYVKVRIPKGGGGWEESNALSASIRLVALTLSEALDTSAFVSTQVAAPWFAQSAVTHDGEDAAQSASLTAYQYVSSEMTTTVQGPAKVSFWWKISAYYNSSLSFSVDYVTQGTIFGEKDWRRFQMILPAGEHTLRWRFYQYYYPGGANSGWVDALKIQPNWPEVSFGSAAQTVSEDVGTVLIPVYLDRAETNTVTVPYTLGGTATAGADYTIAPTGSVSFAPGETFTNITVSVIDDTEQEDDETVVLTLQPETGVLAGAPASHTLTISLNDAPPSVEPPLFVLPSNTVFAASLNVSITSGVAGAAIRYTTNGVDPDAGSTLYAGPVTITTSTTFRARAFLAGYDPSTVVEAVYARSDIPLALDVDSMVLRQGGNAEWFRQTDVSYDGVDAARSGAITHNQNTWMETDVTLPAKVSFHWMTSSENNYDWLSLYTNGVLYGRISGATAWAKVSLSFTDTGPLTLRWTYSKDGSANNGMDAAFVDALSVHPINHRFASFYGTESFVREEAGEIAIPVVLDEPAPGDLHIPVTLSGTALAGSDYIAAPNTVFFASGDTQAFFTVTLIDDAEEELAETLVLTLGPTNDVSIVAPSTYTVTILPSDMPAAQPGLIGWWRADSGVQTNAAGGVTNWLDRSGYNRAFTQFVSDRSPVWLPDAANGNPAVRFDLTNDGMASDLSVASPYTVYLVYSSQSTSTGYRRALQGSSNWILGPYNGKLRHYAGGWIDDGSAVAVTGRVYLNTARNDTTNSAYFIDGVNKTVNANSIGSPGVLHLGASGYAAHALGGDIVEILVYDRALSDEQALVPGSDLASRYRIDTAYAPTALTITTPDQTLPEGTRLFTIEGTATGSAASLIWSNRVTSLTGTLALPANGLWEIEMPLARGANVFAFWTAHSSPVTVSLTVAGPLEPFAAAANDSGELRTALWRSDSGAFAPWETLDTLGGRVRAVTVGDFNNDGFNDILAFHTAGSRHALGILYLNTGSNTFVRTDSVLVSGYNESYIMRAASGDFNGDGNLDVVLGSHANNWPLVLLEGDGTGAFTQRNIPTSGERSRGIAVADFDHDGYADLAVSFYSSGSVYVFFGRNDGSFDPPVLVGNAGNDPYGLAAGDFTGDGHPDIISRSGSSNPTYLFAGTGGRTFAAAVTVPTLALGRHAGFGAYDFTEDGWLDLVSSTEYEVRFHQGFDGGSFTQLTSSAWSYTIGMAVPPAPPPPGTPRVSVTPDQTLAAVGETVGFSATVTDGSAVSSLWSFGDGATASGSPASASHAFAAPGRYTVRLDVTSTNGWHGIGVANLTVTGAVSSVIGGETNVLEAAAGHGAWRVALSKDALLSGATADTRFIVTPDFQFADGFEGGTLDAVWRTPTTPWFVTADSSISGAYALAQTNTALNTTFALLDTPPLPGAYEISTTFRILDSSNPHAGIVFERQRNGLDYRYCWLRGNYNDVLLTLPDGNEITRPLGFDLQTGMTVHLTVRVAGGQVKVWVNDTFIFAAPSNGLPSVGLSTYRSSVIFDDVSVSTLGAEGMDMRPDYTDAFEDGTTLNWRFTAGTWSVTTNTPVIDGSHSLRQSDTSINRGIAICEAVTVPSGDFLFETDATILSGSGEEIVLRVGNPDWATYYELVLRGRGLDDLLVYRYVDGSGAQTVTNIPQSVGWLLPNTPFRIGVARVGDELRFSRDGNVLVTVAQEPRVAELCAFALATYRTDTLFDNIRLATAGYAQTSAFVVGEGTNTFHVAAWERDGQTSTGSVRVVTSATAPASVLTGGPYAVDETAATNGTWTVALTDGSATDAESGIWKAVWDFGFDTFDGTEIDDGKWNANSAITQTNAIFFPAGVNNCAFFSRAAYPRIEGQTFEARLRVDSGWAYFGFKSDNDNGSYGTMVHAIRFYNGNFHIRQPSVEFSTGVPYINGLWYQLRVELKASGGARYSIRPDDATASWLLLHEDYGSASTLSFRRAVATSGNVWLDDVRETEAGLAPVLRTSQPGGIPLTLTAWNHAGQAVASTPTTLTATGNALPVAPFNFNRTLTEAHATNGVWYSTFDASAATDDTGIWKFDWDWTYNSAEGFAPTGERGAVRLHTWTNAGVYSVACRVTDNARQSVLVTGLVTVASVQTPTANHGGPYIVDETTSDNGAWTVSLDGSASTTPIGIIERYVWDLGADHFDQPDVFPYKWIAEPFATVSNGVLSLPDLPSANVSGYVYAYSRDTYARMDGLTAETRVRSVAGNHPYLAFGFRKLGADNSLASMAYSFVLYNGTLYTAQNNGNWQNAGFSFTADTWIELKIALKPSSGARYYVKPDGATTWTQVYDTDTGSDALFHRGWTKHDTYDDAEVDWIRETVAGATPSYRLYGAAGDRTVSLTVRNAGTATHSATTTVTCVTNALPIARITPPSVTRNADTAVGGQWRITFSGAGSSDDHGVFLYDWDFDYDAGAGFRPSGVTSVSPTWTFSGIGSYNVALRVRDHVLQASAVTVCPVTLTAAGTPPTAAITPDVEHAGAINAETGWTVRFNGGTSTGDVALATYTWDFGDGVTGEGANPLHRYLTNGTYTVSLFVTDAAGRDSATTSLPVNVAVSTPPIADAGTPTVGGAGGPPVYFDASQSADDGAPGIQQGIVSYFWDMDTATDSDSNGDPADDIDAVGVTPSYTYASAGTYTVRLVVVDGAGQMATNTVNVTVAEDVAPQVLTPFFQGDPFAAHPALSGVSHRLKGMARDAGALRFQWVYGDGTSNSVANAGNRYNLESTHTYTGAPGTTFVATLRVWDAANNLGEATYPVVIQADTPETRTDIAIDNALWWLHKDQNKSTGLWSSIYNYGWRPVETVGASINAFQKNGHRLDGDIANDPYVESVRLAYDWLFTRLSSVALSAPADSNGNGIGLKTADNESPDLSVSRIVDTLSRSQRYFAMSATGGTDVKHRHFADLVTDLTDYLVSRQRTDGVYRGAWNRWSSSADTAVGIHLGLALRSAQRELGVMIPDAVKSENRVWLDSMVWPTGAFGNRYPYPQNSYDFWSATAGGMQFALMQGLDTTDPRWRDAERWFDEQTWPLNNNSRSYMALWGLSAALREAAPQSVETLWYTGRDWFNDPATGLRQKLLAEQEASGEWYGYAQPNTSDYLYNALATALAVDMLSGAPVALLPKPVIAAPRYWSYGLPLTLSAAQSHHADSARRITRYEWDFDGDGTFDFETNDPSDTNAVFLLADPTPGISDPTTNVTVMLRVTDDAATPKQATASVSIQVGDSPFAPFAIPGGPYLGLTNLAVTVDGSGSYDLDNQPNMHSGITEYQWDFNNDGTPDVVTNAPFAAWSWPTPGTYTIRLRVLDDGLFNEGASLTSEWAEASVEIVANRLPVAVPGGPYFGEEDAPISFSGAGSTDPDPGQTIVAYAWDFTGDTIADVTAGTPDAEWTFTDPGIKTVRLRVQDSDGLWSAWATAEVTVSEVTFYAIVTDVSPASGAGVVTPGGTVRKGDSFTATATVTNAAKYVFSRWRFNGYVVSYATSYTFAVQSAGTLTAEFVLRRFMVSASASPVGFGSVSGTGWWNIDTTNTLTATPAAGCAFVEWRDAGTYDVVSTAPTYAFAVTENRTLIAVFAEVTSSHVITTETLPPGLTVITGAGNWNNGETATFTAPQMIIAGDNRYVFQRYTVNGAYAAAINVWNWKLTRGDPATATVRAEYTSFGLSPKITAVRRTLDAPVPITTNLVATLIFDRTMDTTVLPTVTVSNLTGTVTRVLPAAGGAWTRIYTANDSYRSAPISFARGEDGTYVLAVTGARDPFGSVMAPTNAWTFTVDATPPPLPTVSLTVSNDTSFTVGWAGYAPPPDIGGFRIYVSETAFTNVTGLSPVSYHGSSSRAYTRYGVQLDTDYWVAIMPVDQVGNMETSVEPLLVRIPRAIPPAVPFTVTATGADIARLDWPTYAGNSLGFAGFRIYRDTNAFTTVSNRTPIATVSKVLRTYTATGLDRAFTNWFSVVGFNSRGESLDVVTSLPWTDPYQGVITNNLTIGSDGTVTDILKPLVVRAGAVVTVPAGATLAFHPGAGLTVEDGALHADGTALKPILFTSTETAAPAEGDWNGIRLLAQAGDSLLRHVWIEYGQGLTIDGCAPTVDACTAHYNAPAGFTVLAGGTLDTRDALLLYNAAGISCASGATATVTQSILRNNVTNALAEAGGTLTATNVWWGSADLATLQSGHRGTVVSEPFLTSEPVLTPAADAADGNRNVGVPSIVLALAARVAEAVQISENSLFTGAFYDAFEPHRTVALSAGGGVKTLYIRFRNAAGQVSSTVTVPVTYITGGPMITACNISEGATLTRPFTLTATAASGLGITTLRVLADDVVVATTNTSSLSTRWDVRTLAPGAHRILVEAIDTRGNLGTRSFNVTANIQPPPNPTLTAPAEGLLTTNATVIVAGTAEPFGSVALRRNGSLVRTVIAAANGAFSGTVTLVEGANALVATMTDAFGTGRSNERHVTRDSGAPEAITLQTPTYLPGTGLHFGWLYPAEGEVPANIALLRSAAPFATAGEATWQGPWTTDNPLITVPPADGRWYYAAIGRDAANNHSLLSNLITNDYDGTAPTFSVSYDKASPSGLGPLQISLVASEPLSKLPTVTVLPPSATGPTMLTVSNTAPRRYDSVYNVQSAAGSGTLQVRVSGQDFAGNRAVSVAPTGTVMVLDTQAPSGFLTTTPSGLIQVTNPVPMSVSLLLDEVPAAMPALTFTPPEGAVLAVSLTGGGTNWSGQLELLPTMGSGSAGFTLSVTDALGNSGSQLNGTTEVELYNTALPEPPARVTDLRASTDQAAGVIKLAWLAVADAESYTLYRQSGAAGPAPDQLVAANLVGATHDDLPAEDGFYRYVVVSTRRGADALPSPVALGLSDRTPPPAPTNLTAGLSSNGVRVEWEYPTTGEQPEHFRVYRNGSVLRSRVKAATRFILDNPTAGTWSYTVASVDRNANEALSNSDSVDLTLPAVTRTDVAVGLNRVPVLTWQKRAEHTGVNLYRNGIKLNAPPLSGTSFSDSQLTGSGVTFYEVRGVNAEGGESAARELPVYRLTFGLAVNAEVSGSALLRYFDRCEVTVSNETSGAAFEIAQLDLTRAIAGGDSLMRTASATQTAPSGGTTAVGVTFPSATAPGVQSFAATVVQALDDPSASVTYAAAFEGGTPSLALSQIEITLDEQPVAGAACMPKARFYNRSQVPIDIVMWRSGTPGDVTVRVLDAHETEATRVDVMMPKALLIPTPDNQRGFIRIPARSSTLMTLPEIIVPEALGEDASAFIEVRVAALYSACGQSGEQVSGPLQGRLAITPRATPYTAFGIPERAAYLAGETMVITGYAFDRVTSAPTTNVAVTVGVALEGHAWYIEAQSDAQGNFRAEWPIIDGISGNCQVWASHPQVRDRLNHGQAAIYQAYFRPGAGSIRMAANDLLGIRVHAYNPGSFTFTNLTSTFTAWQIVNGVTNVLPANVVSGAVDAVTSLGLPPKQLMPVALSLFAAEAAPSSFDCRFEIVTPEGLHIPFEATVSVTAPLPLITVATPARGYVDMSLDRGHTRSADIELRNDGFKSLLGVRMTAPTTPWIQVALTPGANGTYALPDIAPGESYTFQVLYAPDVTTPLDYYSEALSITGTNTVTVKTLHLYAKVTSELTGSLFFHVENTLGQVVPDASIRLRNALDGAELTGFKTDANGEVAIPGLMEGRWHWKATASGHATLAGTAQVEADSTAEIRPFLTRQLVTINFSVVPVPFTDRYEIKIEQTFSTYVPAPVLIVDPLHTDLGLRTDAFEMTFDVTAKNHGLIKMTEFTVRGSQHAWGSLVPAISYLPVLAPMQQIVIPYTASYWGEGAGGAPPAPGPLNMPAPMALAGAGPQPLSGGGGAVPQYDPCRDDFMDAVKALTSYLNGQYGSMSGTSLANAHTGLDVIWKVADKAPVGISSMLKMYQVIFCLAELFGISDDGGRGKGSGSAFDHGSGGGSGDYTGTYNGCFAAGTPVLFADGTLHPIENVRPGDLLRTGPREMDVAHVTQTFRRDDAAIRELTLDNGETLRTTPEHRIWCDTRGWTLARNLKAGDRVACTNDTVATITDVVVVEQTETVYTLDLREDFAFYAQGVLVQHRCGMQFPNLTPTNGTESRTKGDAK